MVDPTEALIQIQDEKITALRARVEELKIKTGMQQGLFNAAMDRCDKAEAKVSELEAKLALMEGAVDEERGRCILAMWEEPWPTEGNSLESYIAAITKSLNRKR